VDQNVTEKPPRTVVSRFELTPEGTVVLAMRRLAGRR
jgi:hypothetical protein